MLIEPTQAIPLLIETHSIESAPFDVTWEFDPSFFAVDGGVAPRALEWNQPDFGRERHEFQVFAREWLLKEGQTWIGEARYGTPSITHFEVVDLKVVLSSPTIRRSPDGLALSWPTWGLGGIVLESAGSPEGPWSSIQTPAVSDNTNPVVAIPVTQPTQYYRLRR